MLACCQYPSTSLSAVFFAALAAYSFVSIGNHIEHKGFGAGCDVLSFGQHEGNRSVPTWGNQDFSISRRGQ